MFVVGFVVLLYVMVGWWGDVARESEGGQIQRLGGHVFSLGHGMVYRFGSHVFWRFFWRAVLRPQHFSAGLGSGTQ